MSDRQGVEIDYCPSCRGVWRDRGELDKIIERSADTISSQDSYKQNTYPDFSKYKKQDGHYKKKKESFFSEIFDFKKILRIGHLINLG